MTEYLTEYMEQVQKRLENCEDSSELDDIMNEHLLKIQFMQHERIVHFLVTMLFALVLSIFMALLVVKKDLAVLILVTIILILLVFYIKHYYFLENTVQKMYKVYDEIHAAQRRNGGEKR